MDVMANFFKSMNWRPAYQQDSFHIGSVLQLERVMVQSKHRRRSVAFYFYSKSWFEIGKNLKNICLQVKTLNECISEWIKMWKK